MPRKEMKPGTISYTGTELLLSIIKALMLRRELEEGYTARELAAVLHTNADRVGKILTQLHLEYGLIWISGWRKHKGQGTGSASRSYSLSTAGPFMHADRPRPTLMRDATRVERMMNSIPRSNARWPETVDYLKKVSKNGKFPSYVEVQDALGVSAPTIAKAIRVIRAQQHKATST